MTKNYENLIKEMEKNPKIYKYLNSNDSSLLENFKKYINDLYIEKISGVAAEWEISTDEMKEFISSELMANFWFGFRAFKNKKS